MTAASPTGAWTSPTTTTLGRAPIRRAWFAVAFPALTLNYLGQAGLVLRRPGAVANPFFLLLLHWARIPMVLLATAATVIASQAVISGAFSISRQAVQLGFLPRLTVRHTSEHAAGQVYVPAVNWGLFLAVVVLVLGFESSQRLASAYGVAVTGTFVITTILFLVVARSLWGWPAWKIALAGAVFLSLEVTFFVANLSKIFHGGWLPLVIAVGVFTVMTTWQHRDRESHGRGGPLARVCRGDPRDGPAGDPDPGHRRVPQRHDRDHAAGDARQCRAQRRAARARGHLLVGVGERPARPGGRAHHARRTRLADDGITHVTARIGFQDDPDIPRALRLACDSGLDCDLSGEGPTYFLSRITLRATDAPGMSGWRKRLFVAIAHNAASPVEYFCLPDDRTVTMGSTIPL